MKYLSITYNQIKKEKKSSVTFLAELLSQLYQTDPIFAFVIQLHVSSWSPWSSSVVFSEQLGSLTVWVTDERDFKLEI